jgi:hypothetical protein
VTELVPLCLGAFFGLLLGSLRLAPSGRIVALLAVLLGVCATAVTGELRVAWEYVLVDIPLVGLSAVACFACLRRRRSLVRDSRA